MRERWGSASLYNITFGMATAHCIAEFIRGADSGSTPILLVFAIGSIAQRLYNVYLEDRDA